jgi:hypothetical protein
MIEHRKARQWRSLMTVKRRWNPPYAAFPCAKFGLLQCRVLDQTIGRVRDDGVEAAVRTLLKPLQAIAGEELTSTIYKRWLK